MDLNNLFKKYFCPDFDEILEADNYNDYNSMVDEIIHISPPYNYEKYEQKNERTNNTDFNKNNYLNYEKTLQQIPQLNLDPPRLQREISFPLELSRMPSFLKRENSNFGK